MSRRVRCAVTGLALLAAASMSLAASATATAPRTAASAVADRPADPLKARLDKAVAEARAGRTAEAIAELDEILKVRPDAHKSRLLRAKLYFKLDRLDDADRDAAQVCKARPDSVPAKQLLEKIRNAILQAQISKKKTNATYSEWERVWTINGKSAFSLAQFKGAEGHTLFFAPANPADQSSIEPYQADAIDKNAYFLRVVDLRNPAGKVDLTLPGTQSLKAGAVPFFALLDASGTVLAQGDVGAVEPHLDKLRKAAKKKGAPAGDPVSTVDFSSSEESLESLGSPGVTTVVMVTSPG